MSLFSKKGARVLWLPLDQVRPNPDQPRKVFDGTSLRELAESIRIHGILQPLTVRREEDGSYTLVAGERRLRAAGLAGLAQVPCLPVESRGQDSALLALVENIQRQDLDCWEEAEALRQLTRTYGLSQEQVAARIGKSQSAVANKLRLLKLAPELISAIRSAGLTERHARALLRLPEDSRMTALQDIIGQGLNVAATDAYIDAFLIHPEPAAPKKRRPTIVLRDVRLFLNTLTRGLSTLKRSGVAASWEQEDTGDCLTFTIRIPKQKTASRRAG